MMPSWFGRMVLISLVSCGVAACSLLRPQPDPTQFFVLSPTAPAEGTAHRTDDLIGVGPITLPEYLDRANIVRRFAPNRVAISEYEWWAEPLNTALLRVTGDNLAARLGTPTVLRYPWPVLLKPAYAVVISFSRFDILTPDHVQLAARWVVRGGPAHDALLTRESIIEKPTVGSTTADAVASLSQALGELSDEIASAIQTLHAQTAPVTKPPPRRRAR